MVPTGLQGSVESFARLLLERYPQWASYIRAYQPNHPADETEPGSLWLEIPDAVRGNNTHLSLIVQSTEAVLRVGDRERLFVWPAAERDLAHAEVLGALDTAVN